MPVGRDEAGKKASAEAAYHRPGYIRGGGLPGTGTAPFIVDVGDGDRKNAGSKYALQEAPEKQGGQRTGGSRQQGGGAHGQRGPEDGPLTAIAVRENSGEGG